MSEPAAAEGEAKPKKRKLVIIVVAVLLLVLVGGGAGAFLLLKKNKAVDEEGAEALPAPSKNPPVFMAMDSLVVNLADPGGDRMAQIGITLQVVDQKTADQIKVYMPAIRSKVLLLVSQRTSSELLLREGKEQLAKGILREVGLPLGIEIEEEEPPAADEAPRKKKRKAAPPSPVQAVLFTSFIIQ